jgi:hypothetical protein
MTADPPPPPVIVTRREVERLFRTQPAESAIGEAAAQEGTLEQAQAMAMTGAILRELQKSEDAGGSPGVLVTAQHGPASRLQSLIASGEAGQLSLQEMPSGGLEAKFDTQDWLGWATVAWAMLKNPKKHPLIRPVSKARPLPGSGRIALIGDWGTGLYGAPQIAVALRNDPDPFAMMVHLGDVYYAGTQKEVTQRFLEVWPRRPEAIHRALNSNHEMYSGGHPYFKSTLPAFDQEASYFAYQNDHWTLVGLDVAHIDHGIDDEQVDWLTAILQQAGERKVIILSHQQLFSGFESQGDKLWAHPGFAAILRSRRIFAWIWAHEHRCTVYREPDEASGLLGRCIGHGGMPQSRKKTRGLPKAPGFDRADWRLAPAKLDGSGRRLAPPGLVLEGRNPYIKGEEDDFTPHGYAVLTFDGKFLLEQIMDADGEVIYENRLA